MGMGGMGGGSAGVGLPPEDPTCPKFFPAPKFSFVVQVVWQEKPLSLRIAAQEKAAEEAKAAAAAAAGETAETQENPVAPIEPSPATEPVTGPANEPAIEPTTETPASDAPSSQPPA